MQRSDRSKLRKAALVVVGCIAVAVALHFGQLPDPVQQPSSEPEQQITPAEQQSAQDVGVQDGQDPQPLAQDDGMASGGEVPVTTDSTETSEQPAPTDDDVSTEAPSDDANAEDIGETVELPLLTEDAADVSVSESEDDASHVSEAPADEVRAEVTRKVEAVIPQAKRPSIPKGANYEQGVLLVIAEKGTTADQLAQNISQAGIQSVTSQDVTLVADDMFEVKLAPSAKIEDAIFDLERTGVAKSAQPNYLYQVAEKTPDDLVIDVEETMGVAPTTPAEPTPTMSTEPAPTPAEPAPTTTTTVEPAPAPTTAAEPAPSTSADVASQDQEFVDETVEPVSQKPSDEVTTQQEPSESLAEEENTTNNISVAANDATAATTLETAATKSAKDLVNDPYAKDQWGLNSMDVPDAWAIPAISSATTKVRVAVLDDGFNATHTDLKGNVAFAYDATTQRTGVNYMMTNDVANASHGTHVAGIVAATSNNQLGISGVGNNHLQLALFRLFDDTKEEISTEALDRSYSYLINYGNDYNIRVANMSVGMATTEESIASNDDAILQKVDEAYANGIVSVASSGNNTPDTPVPYWNYPSDYETVVSVINLRNTNSSNPKSVSRDSTSNYNLPGKRAKDISAPGTNIYSTVPTNAYEYKTGTSMASPSVAGVVGLMFVANPSLTASQAVSGLYNTARDIGATGWDEQYGYGEVNAAAAVQAVTTAVMDGPEFLATGSTATYSVTSNNLNNWTFSSSNPSVLEVTTDGTATAHTFGIANVIATSNDNTGVTVTQEVKVMGPITGNRAVALYGSVELSVSSPTNQVWSWSSNDKNVATVTNKGVVYGHAVGHTTITATLVADRNVSLSYEVVVYDCVQGDVFLPVKSQLTLSPDDQNANDSEATITWESSNANVATVDQNGVVTAVRSGGTAIACVVTKGSNITPTVWPVYVYGPIAGKNTLSIGQTTKLSIAGWDLLNNELKTGWTWALGEGSSTNVATVAADGTVTAKAKGKVTVVASRGEGSNQVRFTHDVTVNRISLNAATITIPKQTYTGKQLTPVPVVKIGTTTLKAGTDYTVQYSNTVNAGTHQVTITGMGKYEGKRTAGFVIVPKKVAIPSATNRTYNGAAQTGVAFGNYYTLSGTYKATNAGTYTATVALRDARNNQWSNGTTANQRITWKIGALSLGASNITVTKPNNVTYNGNSQTPRPTVKFAGRTLREGTDYTLGYSNNVNSGTATVKITGKGNFTGSRNTNFQIASLTVRSATISGLSTQMYTGKLLTPKPQVKVGNRTLREGSDYTLSYKNNLVAGTATVTVAGKGNYKDSKSANFTIVNPSVTVAYQTHVENVGWQDWRRNGVMSGTSGQGLRLEGINIKLEGQKYSGGIEYRTHVQNIGWQDWRSNGAMSGTSGRALRLEAIQIRLTGDMAAQYDVWYRVHAQNFGWLGWAKNGERAGTATYGYRLEGINIMVLPKGSAAPGDTANAYRQHLVGYTGHVQNIGWQSMASDGEVSGTSGRGLRVEAVTMQLIEQPYSGGIQYRSHVQNIGWQAGWRSNGQMSGTSGRGYRVEAIQVRLTGDMAAHYDVWYRVHAQNFGWLGWTKNGESAGTAGFGYRVEAYQVVLVSKGGRAPGSTANPFRSS